MNYNKTCALQKGDYMGVVCAYKPSTQPAGTGRSQRDQDQLQLLSKFQANLDYLVDFASRKQREKADKKMK